MLNTLQQELQHLYDLDTPLRVEDFLVQDAEWVKALTGRQDTAGPDEQLLVLEGDECLDVSLFLSERILEGLLMDDPGQSLHSGNLADFWLAVEGVSHFLHLVCHAHQGRAITRLELELLAEIDKLVIAAGRVAQQTGWDHARPLHRLLFEACRFRDDLSPACRHRYHEANRLAARYCRSLDGRYRLSSADPDLRTELRRFQRMPKADKLHHIEIRMARRP